MEKRIYSSDENVQFDKTRVNYIKPDQLYKTINLIRKRHENFRVAEQHEGPKRYLLPTGLVEIFGDDRKGYIPEILITSRTEVGLRRLVNSLLLPLGHAPEK